MSDRLEDVAPEIALPPTQDELPCDDGIPMETERHKLQMDLLIYTLRPWLDRHPEGGVRRREHVRLFQPGPDSQTGFPQLPTARESLAAETRRAETAEAEVARLRGLLGDRS